MYSFTNVIYKINTSVVMDKILNRPECCNIGCTKLVHLIGYSSTGTPKYRPYCGSCHRSTYKGLPFAEGVTSVKKNYCQYSDGRLGFACATKGDKLHSCMMDLDHIDGNHYNNDSNNIQTLCKNCHAYKTKMNGDNRTGW